MTEQTSTALISIIIPVGPNLFDLSKLQETLSLNKNLRNIQFILVVDSPDTDYFDFIRKMANEIQLADCCCLNVNFGNPGQTRNAGLSISSGRWIQFWDSDDVGDLNPFVESLENREADLIVQQYKLMNTESNKIRHSDTKDILNLVSNPGLWRIAIRRSFLNGVKFPALSMAEDQVFIFNLLTMNPKIEFSKSLTYSYFVGSGAQLTSQKNKMRDLPKSMKLISATDCRNTYGSEFIQLLFLEKILAATMKHAEMRIICQSIKIFTEYFFRNISRKFLINFIKSTAWLVRVNAS